MVSPKIVQHPEEKASRPAASHTNKVLSQSKNPKGVAPTSREKSNKKYAISRWLLALLSKNQNIAPRIKRRRIILLCLLPILLALAVMGYKFAVLHPSSSAAQRFFHEHDTKGMRTEYHDMSFLFTYDETVPGTTLAGALIIEHKNEEAYQILHDLIARHSDLPCSVYRDLFLVAESVADDKLAHAHFSRAMELHQEQLSLIDSDSHHCFISSEVSNPVWKKLIDSGHSRVTEKYNQADQGVLAYTQHKGTYTFYYEMDPRTKKMIHAGKRNNPCAGLADQPKKECIIKRNPPHSMPPPPPPQPRNNPSSAPEIQNKTKPNEPANLDGKPVQHPLHPHAKPPAESLGDYIANGDNKNNYGN